MRSPFRGVLFDKDGTIIDFEKSWGPVIRHIVGLLAGGDAQLEARLFAAGGHDPHRGRTTPGTVLAVGTTAEIAEVWAPLLGLTDIERLTARMDAVFSVEGPVNATPVPGLSETIDTLSGRGLRIGLATSDSEAAAEKTLAILGLRSRFEFVCGYDSGHGHKPGPGMVLGYCKALDLAPSEVVVIGDNLHDLEMGRAAGAGWVVGVLTGTGDARQLEAVADTVLPSIADLPALLLDRMI